MTRRCSNCSAEMDEGYKVKLDNSPFANLVVCRKGKSAKTDAYVCPNCGKVELYIRDSVKEG